MRGEFRVPLTRDKVRVVQRVLIIRSPETAEIVKARSQNPKFTLDIVIKEWDGFGKTPAEFKVTGLARSAYRVTEEGEIEIMVPELADLVATHREKPTFSMEIRIADDAWMSPPIALGP